MASAPGQTSSTSGSSSSLALVPAQPPNLNGRKMGIGPTVANAAIIELFQNWSWQTKTPDQWTPEDYQAYLKFSMATMQYIPPGATKVMIGGFQRAQKKEEK